MKRKPGLGSLISTDDGPSSEAGPRTRHIALFLPSLDGGGAERVILNIAAELLRLGHRVDLLVCRNDGSMQACVPAALKVIELASGSRLRSRWLVFRADPLGFGAMARSTILPMKSPRRLKHIEALARYLREETPDALLSALTLPNMIAVWARRLAKVETRLVISEHETLSFSIGAGKKGWRDRYQAAAVRRSYRMADAIVTVSRGVADDLALTAGLDRSRINTIYNPVLPADFAETSRNEVDHPFLGAGSPPVVLACGRLVDLKDHETLLRAFAVARREREMRLIIIGEGKTPQADREARGKLQALAASLGIEDDFALPGFVNNPEAWMRRCGAFVLSSRSEAFPMVLIEALASGCPVVSTDCRHGPRELLGDSDFGRLVPVGDAEGMAEAILDSLRDPGDRSRRQARCREFEVAKITGQYLKLLLP